MSTWRRKALEFLPEIRLEIESSDSVGYLWIEIFNIFCRAVENSNDDFIKRTLKYLIWCTSDDAGEETRQSLYCGFLESIARKKNYWPFFKNWFSKKQFEQYKGSFMYVLSKKEYSQLEDTFYER
jgi:hypothetical protein